VDELVPRLDERLADVAVGFVFVQFGPQLGRVVVADESDVVAGPAPGDGVERAGDRPALAATAVVAVEVATAALVALAKQECEDGARRVGGPFPELGDAPDALGADKFFFVGVHGSEVLTHIEEGSGG
jgi:hypothetical protein